MEQTVISSHRDTERPRGTFRCIRHKRGRVYIYHYAWRGRGAPKIGSYSGSTEAEALQQEFGDRDALHRRFAEVEERALEIWRRRGRKSQIEEVALQVFVRARKRATARQMPFSITEDEARDLLARQNYRCALSGIPFRHNAAVEGEGWRAAYRPSLDRIDCREGYVSGNVRFVLVAVNVALSDWGEDVLMDIAAGLWRTRHTRTKQSGPHAQGVFDDRG